MPQFSNVLVAVLFGIVLVQKGSSPSRELMPLLIVISFFTLYVTIVNSVVTVANFDIKILLYAAYYIYNLLLIYVVFSLYTSNRKYFFWTTTVGLITSLLLQAFYVLVMGADEERASAGFDNPNALGYFALLVASSIFALSPKIRIHLGLYLITAAASFYLVIRSVSKAAMVSLFIVLLIGFWKRPIVAILLVVCSIVFIHVKRVNLLSTLR